MLKVGLIGVGNISRNHISAWNSMEDAELVALCDDIPEQMAPYPEQHHYTTLEDMLAGEKLDIVDICLPTFLHAEAACKAMNAGVNVICEKPISLHREDVDLIYETARRNNVKFMVAQVIRFWPAYELVKRLYDEQTYGKLLSGSMTRLGSWPSKRRDNWMMQAELSGLVPFDLHIHDLDFMVYAFGAPQKKHVFQSNRPDQHYLSAVYEYEDFFINAEASWYASPYPFSMKFRFQFEEAIVALEGDLKIYERSGNVINLSAEEQDPDSTLALPKTGAYAAEIRYFADCVKSGAEPDKIKPEQLETVIDILKSF